LGVFQVRERLQKHFWSFFIPVRRDGKVVLPSPRASRDRDADGGLMAVVLVFEDERKDATPSH
jgi:hypothetical protein